MNSNSNGVPSPSSCQHVNQIKKGILKSDSHGHQQEQSPHQCQLSKNNTESTEYQHYHNDKHLKWDEAKLAETEAGKCATMKITEPKTPFEHSIQPYSEDDDSKMNDKFRLQSDSDASTGRSSSIFGTSPSDWESGDELTSSAVGSGMGEEDRVKHDEQFARMRKEHYRMKEALKKGRELVRSESEDLD